MIKTIIFADARKTHQAKLAFSGIAGVSYRNPAHWRGEVEKGFARCVTFGDYPAIKEAYKAAGVEVENRENLPAELVNISNEWSAVKPLLAAESKANPEQVSQAVIKIVTDLKGLEIKLPDFFAELAKIDIATPKKAIDGAKKLVNG